MKQGIIFDMDGTLWDAGVSIAKAWNIVIKRRGLEIESMTADHIHSIMGKTIDGIADAQYQAHKTLDAVDAIYELHHGEKIADGFLEPKKRG